MNKNKALQKLMEEKGFRILRCAKHVIWINNDGIRIVTSRTPSDYRTLRNIEASIKKATMLQGKNVLQKG